MNDIRSLFISDVHLGSRHANTGALLAFLDEVKDNHTLENLYIVGDFIDGWKLKRNWYWNDESNLVIRKILSLLRRGTTIYYVAGNHDEFLREFIEDFHVGDFGSIHIADEFVHETADGRKLLVVHGDMFDMVTRYARWLCWIGDVGYEFLLHCNKWVHKIRSWFGFGHWSLAQAMKSNVKQACNFVSDFETHLSDYAREKGCSGVVCGHIHTADLRETGGFLYANTGDWVESCTALVESRDGTISLYKHHERNDV